ncbi:hypothetical protein B9Z55_027637 [Caenorhabditis nigoni]|uniref:F-box domain-containing protein n=1 Tax=Caenorhabditis nigoni TaxID=1611254 RepID=A0A2G5SEM4_9PELO|nr:hypothetical protein B9Z55_027637 [Caenorhabditis nigoni]
MPFPILRTPFVVVSEIISLLQPDEIVTASYCSNKVKRLLKGHYQQRKPLGWMLYLINWDSQRTVAIGLESEKDLTNVLSSMHISELDKSSEAKPIETNGYKKEFSFGSVDLYFEDPVKGTKIIVDYVTDLFNLDVYGLIIDIHGIWALDWISTRQEKMLECFEFVKNAKYNLNAKKDLDYVLRNARVSRNIVLEDVFPVNYRFDGILGPAINLTIDSNGHWVTLDNLKNFDFVKIKVKGSTISASDVHSFLRHWRAGGSHRLTYLEVHFEADRNFENLEEVYERIDDPMFVFSL